VIESFGNSLAEDLFFDRQTRATRMFAPELRRIARRKLLYVHDATELKDLRVPPGNRLERLKGDRQGFHSIRINDQWRLVLRWTSGNAHEVAIVDYHG
jgi:proteic killer suppression protein